jgi:MoaA/NifB/PqqE/SkfB family radical SAM enzyme/8-oxo-dGTP pyrophosphatase MutT (NUDIX family)
MRRNDLFWARKAPFFARLDGGSHQGTELKCGQPSLWKAAKCDRVANQFGLRVLSCVDIIVFREDADGVRFLMLKRRPRGEVATGWEYPKGGLEYHETEQEGAIRELLEETGTESIGSFFYGGDLGLQTSDVSWRGKKSYDTLRVRGLTYLFAGQDEDLKLGDEHDAFRWETLEDAREKLWIGRYGEAFFESWQRQRSKILRQIARPVSVAFQVTEECPFKCRFCLRRSDREKSMELERKKEVIDLLAERGVQRLTFTGGEILTIGKEEVFQFIKHAHDYHVYTCLSTTGSGLTRDDLHRLDRILDQLLLPLHSIKDETLPLLFDDPSYWGRHRDKVASIMAWNEGRGLIIEVSTVVSRQNFDEVAEIGRWIFERSPRVLWRIDEYYANGIAVGSKDLFEISSERFQELEETLARAFPEQCLARRVRFSSKQSRGQAPDVMITPEGNLVTSSNHSYEIQGDYRRIPYWDFKNRRPWTDYRDYVRADWEW